VLPNPVVDLTGLKGSWDFDLKWTTRALLSQAGADGISIFDAVDTQLGLKLHLQTVPAPAMVIERVNQKPADNPPGVAQSLPPSPTEFEVAVIKVSRPDERFVLNAQPGGRMELRAWTMRKLINFAWWNWWDTPQDMLAGGPKWLDSTHFDIIAKASTARDAGQPADRLPTAPDPSGALSIFDAVTKQLGLKLELRKRTMPILVIDHIDENPTEN
jgi:Protein of unknown function (DUF3738)